MITPPSVIMARQPPGAASHPSINNASGALNMNQINNITRGLTVTTLAAAIALSGCANMSETQPDAAKGAGIGALAGVLLGWLVSPAFFGFAAFVGAGLTFAGISGFCGMARLLAV
eukprot:gene17836-biopygen10805